MARQKKKSSTPASPVSPEQQYHLENDAPWGGFINIRLDDDQKEEFHLWHQENAAHFPAAFEDMLGDGVKVSFSYDAPHQCYVCSVMGALVGSDAGSRYASTSRAGTMPEVIALSVWKHYVLCGGDYGNYRPKDSSFMSWG